MLALILERFLCAVAVVVLAVWERGVGGAILGCRSFPLEILLLMLMMLFYSIRCSSFVGNLSLSDP